MGLAVSRSTKKHGAEIDDLDDVQALQRQIDELAARAELDDADLKMRNLGQDIDLAFGCLEDGDAALEEGLEADVEIDEAELEQLEKELEVLQGLEVGLHSTKRLSDEGAMMLHNVKDEQPEAGDVEY